MDFRTNRLFKNFRWIYSSKKCNLCNFPFSSDRSYSYKAKHISNCPSMWMFGIFPVGSFLLKMWTNTFTFICWDNRICRMNFYMQFLAGTVFQEKKIIMKSISYSSHMCKLCCSECSLQKIYPSAFSRDTYVSTCNV